MVLLLDLKRDNVPVTKVVVEAAAGNEKSGKGVMALLLDQRGAEVKITGRWSRQQLMNGASRGDGTTPGPARRRGPDHRGGGRGSS